MASAELTRSLQQQWDGLAALLAAYAVKRPVTRVAVVGNAPVEPDERRAAEIDASDLVIRMNSLKLDEPGEPPCLGSACHVVLLSRNTRMTPWSLRDYRNRLYLVPQAGFTVFHGLRDAPEHWPSDLGAVPVPNGAVTARIADRLQPDRVPASIIPTSGTIALFLAHEMFPAAEHLAAGFSFVDGVQRTEWAHHSGGSTSVNDKHRLDREGALLRSWVDDGSLRLLP